MNTTKMSVTRALAELKRLATRIERETLGGTYVSYTVGLGNQQKMTSGSLNVTDTLAKIQGSYDTVNSLIDNRQKIKAAILASNSVTLVAIGGKEMTVASAIEWKNSVVFKKALLTELRKQYLMVTKAVDTANEKLEAAIELMVTNVLGASDKSKVDASAFDTIAVPQRNAKSAKFLDPMEIQKQIKELEEEISLVETELDFVLSTSNAKTEIEV